MKRLLTSFFNRPTLQVSQDLLGKLFIYNEYQGIITETEAYTALNDPACHAYKGPTSRNAPMFGEPGHTYVYLIYGVYHCINFVTEPKGVAAAVLIRGLYLLKPSLNYLNGPGKLCRELHINRTHSGLSLTYSDDLVLYDIGLKPEFNITPRVGLTQGKELLWRFILKNPLEIVKMAQLFLTKDEYIRTRES